MKYLEIPALLGLTNRLMWTSGDRKISGRVECYSCKSVREDKKLYAQLQEHYKEVEMKDDDARFIPPNRKSAPGSPSKKRKAPKSKTHEEEKPQKEQKKVEHSSPKKLAPPPPSGVGKITKPDDDAPETEKKKKNVASSPLLQSMISTGSPALRPLGPLASRDTVPGTPTNIGDLQDKETIHMLQYLMSTLGEVYPNYDFRETSPNEFHMGLKLDDVEGKINKHLEVMEREDPGITVDIWKAIGEIVGGLDECKIYSYDPIDSSDIFKEGTVWHQSYFFYNEQLKKMLYMSVSESSKLHQIEEVADVQGTNTEETFVEDDNQ